jgi:hypothetical protein
MGAEVKWIRRILKWFITPMPIPPYHDNGPIRSFHYEPNSPDPVPFTAADYRAAQRRLSRMLPVEHMPFRYAPGVNPEDSADVLWGQVAQEEGQ